MGPAYATVEQLQAAADFKTTAFEQHRLRRILEAASRDIDKRLHRHFYPLVESRQYIDAPSVTLRRTRTAGFWLETDLLSLTSATVDSVAQTVADIDLYPSQYGPPYSWIGLTGSDITIVGVFGYSQDTAPAGELAANVSSVSATQVDVSDSQAVGIGDLIAVNAERMLVSSKSMLDTTEDLAADLTADMADNVVTVSDGSAFTEDELVLIDAERMQIVDIAGNDLIVKRAYDGSVLASHDGTSSPASVYAPRRLTVTRGEAGTTAATHTAADPISRNVPPGPITDLCIAEALTTYEQETAGYARVIGSGEAAREARGAGLEDARTQAGAYKRMRLASV